MLSPDVLRRNLIQGHKKVQAKLPHSIDLDAVDDDVYNNFARSFQILQALQYTLTFIPESYIYEITNEVETIKGRIS
jgi:hypothetical protein